MSKSFSSGHRPRWVAGATVAAGAGAAFLASRRSRGRLSSDSIGARVTIDRDRLGVPHITAARRDDALFGLGFAIASDRLWQMDLIRRTALGRLSEIAGPTALSSDRTMRLIDMPSIVDACVAIANDDARAAMTAFCEGVNARIRRRPLPVEFRLARYRPEPWRPRDCVAAVRLMGWVMAATHDADLVAEELTGVLGVEWADALLLGTRPSLPPPDASLTRAAPVARRARVNRSAGVGSNAWAISAGRSETGAPILSSDPHLAYTNPSLWYEARISAPGFSVAGMTIPGIPGIGIGRTPTFAWAFTASMISQAFVYRESLSEDGTSIVDGDARRPLEIRHETIHVNGEEPYQLTVRSTPRGPLLSDISPLPSGQPFSLYWTGMEPGREIEGVLCLNAASTVDEGLRARELVVVPSFNIIAADTTGVIERRTVGRLTRRSARPGFHDPSEFQPAPLSADDAPGERDPGSGFVVNSNNEIHSPGNDDIPLRGNWEPDYRIERITARLGERERHSPAEMRLLQTDRFSSLAASTMATLLEYLDGHVPEWIIADLAGWNFEADPPSRPALLFEAFWNQWTLGVLRRRLPDDLARAIVTAISGAAQFRFYTRLLRGEYPEWFRPDSAADVARTAFTDALRAIVERLGPVHEHWTWGELHRLTFAHPLGEASARLARVVDVGPLPVGGDRSTVWMSWWDPEAPFDVVVGPSMRLVADLSHPDRLWITNTLGQNGRPLSRSYHDQTADFLEGRMHPVPASPPKRWLEIVPRSSSGAAGR